MRSSSSQISPGEKRIQADEDFVVPNAARLGQVVRRQARPPVGVDERHLIADPDLAVSAEPDHHVIRRYGSENGELFLPDQDLDLSAEYRRITVRITDPDGRYPHLLFGFEGSQVRRRFSG